MHNHFFQHRFHPFLAQHRGGHHGFGHFGRGFMEGGGMGGRGFGMGRKLASADLQLLILRLLEEKPRHGYEVIKELDERSKGFYVPSPGMVYPALTYLEEIGHATVQADGTRKLYSITEAGQAQLEANRSTADGLLAQFERVGDRMDRVRQAMDAGEAGDETAAHEARGSKELHRARRSLKQALLDKIGSSKQEQQRIAMILQKAAVEIAGK
jgi:DNA-binding PadR family transcriptional regulator